MPRFFLLVRAVCSGRPCPVPLFWLLCGLYPHASPALRGLQADLLLPRLISWFSSRCFLLFCVLVSLLILFRAASILSRGLRAVPLLLLLFSFLSRRLLCLWPWLWRGCRGSCTSSFASAACTCLCSSRPPGAMPFLPSPRRLGFFSGAVAAPLLFRRSGAFGLRLYFPPSFLGPGCRFAPRVSSALAAYSVFAATVPGLCQSCSGFGSPPLCLSLAHEVHLCFWCGLGFGCAPFVGCVTYTRLGCSRVSLFPPCLCWVQVSWFRPQVVWWCLLFSPVRCTPSGGFVSVCGFIVFLILILPLLHLHFSALCRFFFFYAWHVLALFLPWGVCQPSGLVSRSLVPFNKPHNLPG